jgi:hypothetical protein
MKNQRKSRRLAALLSALTAVSFILYGMGHPSAESTNVHLGHVQPRHASQINGSPWGIQAGSLNREDLARAAAIGIKWTRLGASWREIEKQKGIYDWSATDAAFDAALENGITPFVCLAVSNRLYCKEAPAGDPRETEVYGSNPLPPTSSPEALQAWLRFVRSAVERYEEKIHYWEVWNEPNHSLYWGTKPSGEDYGVLVRETARVIKEVDPSAKVLGGALAGLDPEFTDKFLANGVAALVDIVTFHNYAATPEERIYKAQEVWSVIRKRNPSLELWQGECGYPSHSSTRDFRGISPWGVLIQAKWLLRQSFTDVYFCRATLSNYFKLVHEGGRGKKPKRSFLMPIDSVLGFPERGGSRVKSVGVNEKCILENPGLKPKPAYYAYQNLCAVFDNRYSPIDVESDITVRDPGFFYGIGDEDDAFPSKPLLSTFRAKTGACFMAYWLPWHPQEIIQEGRISLTARGVRFAEPVLVDLLSGEVRRIEATIDESGATVFKDLPLTDYPLVIVEKQEIVIGNEANPKGLP